MSTSHASRSQRSALDDLRADRERYREDSWLGRWWLISERSFWAIAVYRLGQLILSLRNPLARRVLAIPYSILHTVTQILTNIEIPPGARIGPGLRIHHGMGVVINAGVIIGKNAVLRQGVTVGARTAGGTEFPVIGDGVEFGAYAQVFGGVVIGDRVRIGAMSVVLDDVPAGLTVIGAPARVVRPRA